MISSSLSGMRRTKPSSDHIESDFEAAFGAKFCGDGHTPRGVNASAKGSEDADAAIAEFVAAGFDDDVLIAGNAGGGDGLFFEIAQEIFGGVGVEAVSVNELSESGGTWEGE